MITGADFDKSFNAKVKNFEMKPTSDAEPFIGSYPPVSRPGDAGRFFVNTSSLIPPAVERVGACSRERQEEGVVGKEVI
jgi:hypothetical protein